METKDRKIIAAYMRKVADALDANEKNGTGTDSCTASIGFSDGRAYIDFHIVLLYPNA